MWKKGCADPTNIRLLCAEFRSFKNVPDVVRYVDFNLSVNRKTRTYGKIASPGNILASTQPRVLSTENATYGFARKSPVYYKTRTDTNNN